MATKNNKNNNKSNSGGIKKAPVKKSSTVKNKTGNTKKLTKKTSKTNKSTNKDYVRISENSQASKFKEMGEKVQKGELKWSFYAIDGNVGYHYYVKLK